VESADHSDSSKSGAIKIRDDFPHQWAQFEVDGFVGDWYIQCSVIKSDNNDFLVAHHLNFSRRKSVQDRMQDTY
jgi:hypothetical protein